MVYYGLRLDKGIIPEDIQLTHNTSLKEIKVSQFMENKLPGISVITPTLNSARVLKRCLFSIGEQEYPHELLEVIVADGGSVDRTLQIVKEFNETFPNIRCLVVPNKLQTGEAGKAAGLKHAKNDVVAFIDSDNILPGKHWLKRMVEPFNDKEIIATEPIEYTYRPKDGYITRYCALLGMNDPLCLFLGNYDRYCILTGKWTEMPHNEEDKGGYLKVELTKECLPTIGANGFLIRRSVLLSAFTSNPASPLNERWYTSDQQSIPSNISYPDYLFDIDVIYEVLNTTSPADCLNPTNPIRLAKVKTGIVHIFSGNMPTFARKQRRRVGDYLYYNKSGLRKYPWNRLNKFGIGKFVLACLLMIPLLLQSVKGYLKKPDIAWFFHPIACWTTLIEYGLGSVIGRLRNTAVTRKRWAQ